MENILILDTETTGLDHTKGQVLEVAAILYNLKTRTILTQASTLIYATENPAFEINRISVDSLKNVARDSEDRCLRLLHQMIVNCSAIVAHNAEFDKKWISTVPLLWDVAKHRDWICTRNDVVWPIRKGIPLSLISIAADLGVPIISSHRGLADCQLLLNSLECIEDIEIFLDKSGAGRSLYYAKVNFDQRQLVKDAGFLWDNNQKVWHAKLTPEQVRLLPFEVYPAGETCASS